MLGKALDGDAHGDLIRRLRGKIDPTRRITPCRSWLRSRHPDKGGPGESYTERDREASGGDWRWAVMLSAHHLTRVAPRPLTPLPSLPQPHPRLIPVREFHASRFDGALYSRDCVVRNGDFPFALSPSNRRERKAGRRRYVCLRQIREVAACSDLRGSDQSY
jgi:hypothetical protein